MSQQRTSVRSVSVIAVVICGDVPVGQLAGDVKDTLRTIGTGRTKPDTVVIAHRGDVLLPRLHDVKNLFDVCAQREALACAEDIVSIVRPERDTSAGETYLWLLPAGTQPAPDALTHLVAAMEDRADVGIVAPKIYDLALAAEDEAHDRPHRLSRGSVGYTHSAWGRIVPLAGEAEPDMGQLDSVGDVLGANLTGAIVTPAAFDAANIHLADALETSDSVSAVYTARAAGYSTTIQTTTHALGSRPRDLTRFDQVSLRLARCRPAVMPLLAIAFLIGGVFRCLGRLFVKQPQRGLEDLRGTWSAVLGTRTVSKRRSRLSTARSLARSETLWSERDLRLSAVESIRFHRDRLASAFAGAPRIGAGKIESREPLGVLGWVSLLVVLAVPAVTWWSFLESGSALGGGLGRGLGTPSALWDAAVSGLLPTLGEHAEAEPGKALWAVWVALFPSSAVASAWALYVTVPLSALTMWLATRHIIDDGMLRRWAALAYAATPALSIGAGQGMLSTAWAIALAPAALAGLFINPSEDSAKPFVRASRNGVALAVVGLLNPLLSLTALLAHLATAILHKTSWKPLLWQTVVALSFSAPFLARTLWSDARTAILADLGVGFSVPALSWWGFLLGGFQPNRTFGIAALHAAMVAVPLVIAVAYLVTSIVRKRTDNNALAGWMSIALASAVWALTSGVSVGTNGSETQVASTSPLAVVAMSLIVLAVHGVSTWTAPKKTRHIRRTRSRGIAVSVMTIAALGAVCLSLHTGSQRSPLSPDSALPIPLVAYDSTASQVWSRTLILTAKDGTITTRVVGQGAFDVAGSSAVERAYWLHNPPSPAQQAVARTIAQISSASKGATGTTTALGVGYIVVSKTGDASVVERLSAELSASEHFVPVGEDDSFAAWRLGEKDAETAANGKNAGAVTNDNAESLTSLAPVSVARIESGRDEAATDLPFSRDGSMNLGIAPGPLDRRLVLSVPADNRWRAEIDGTPLEATTEYGWAQGFTLGEASGTLRVWYSEPWADAARLGSFLLVLAAMVVALPSARRKNPEPIVDVDSTTTEQTTPVRDLDVRDTDISTTSEPSTTGGNA